MGKYDCGPPALARKRLQRLIELGLVPANVEAAPPTGKEKHWDKMSGQEKKESARKMEVFAAMVDLMDQNIGRVIQYLESINELNDTFILFMSDNGAEGAAMEALPVSVRE